METRSEPSRWRDRESRRPSRVEEHGRELAVDLGSNGRGVARRVVGRFPEFLAARYVECHHARALPSDIHEQLLVDDERRTCDAEEALVRLVIVPNVAVPDALTALGESRAEQVAVGAERKSRSIRDSRRRTRAIIEAEVVPVLRCV